MNQSYLDFLFSAEGRITRKEYWIGSIVVMVTAFAGFMVLVSLFQFDIGFSVAFIGYAFFWLTQINITIKRLHDRNYSGKWIWFGLVPVVGTFWLLIEAGFLPTKEVDNQYGPNPLHGVHGFPQVQIVQTTQSLPAQPVSTTQPTI